MCRRLAVGDQGRRIVAARLDVAGPRELEIPLQIWAVQRGLPAELAAPLRVVSDELTLTAEVAAAAPRLAGKRL